MKILSNEEIRDRMCSMDHRSRAKLYATLLNIQDAMSGISADGREIVLSMWLDQTLGKGILKQLIDSEEN